MTLCSSAVTPSSNRIRIEPHDQLPPDIAEPQLPSEMCEEDVNAELHPQAILFLFNTIGRVLIGSIY